MFIRYNEAAKYWEYDSSLSKAGGGPWIILPIDISQIVGSIPPAQLPANIAYRDINNNFASSQVINGGLVLTGSGAGGGVYERNRSVAVGSWIDIPFNAADFSGIGGMIWTVTSTNTFAYSLVGNTLFLSLFIASSTLGGILSSTLSIKLPFTLGPSRYMIHKAGRGSINGTTYDMEVYGPVNTNTLNVIMANDAAFPALGTFRLDFAGFFEIV